MQGQQLQDEHGFRFSIEEDFRSMFPEAMIGVVVVRGIDNARDAEACARLLDGRSNRRGKSWRASRFRRFRRSRRGGPPTSSLA